MKLSSFFVVAALIALFTINVQSQSVIFNEVYNSSASTDEWVELLVLQDNTDLRNWTLGDYTNAGSTGATLTFSTNSMWSSLMKGTIIVIGQSGVSFTEDTDPSDYLVKVKGTNATYFSGTVFTIGGAGESVYLKNASSIHVYGVSWGAAHAGILPQPKIFFAGSSSSNTSTAFKGDAVSQLADTVNWLRNTTSTTQAAGNTAANIAWITSLRSRAEGAGTVSISPTVMNGSTDTTLVVTYHRDTAYAINNLRIIIPSDFSWSKSSTDVSFLDMTATVDVIGDTIYFTGAAFTNDSSQITVQHLTTPVLTGYYKIKVQSGISGTYGDVSPTPVMTVYGAAIPISEVKVNDATGVSTRIGDLVTVRGIITVANEFGSPSYIMDNSGGMSIYGTIFSSSVTIGDEVTVSGKITQFSGLNQIEYPTTPTVLSTANSVEPLLVASPSVLNSDGVGGVENYEGRLVRLNGVTVTTLTGSTVTTWSANTNYRLTGSSASDTVQIRIDNTTNLVGTVAPGGAFDVVGVLSQYKTSAPLIGGYQLMPRSTADILSQGPIISEYPQEVDLTPTSFGITWKTLNPGTSRVRYGKTTAYELGVVEIHQDSMQTSHYVPVTGLEAATIYDVQAFSTSGTDTSFASNLVVSTTSSLTTTGQINIYFTKSINSTVSSGEVAQGNYDVVSKIVQRINAAKRSIDASLYSLSGTAGATVATALVSAKQRGVQVRVIGEYDNRSTAPWSTLQNNGIPVIFDLYGSNDGTGLMHNKFVVFDYKNGAPESVWVWTGSCNLTDPGTGDDRQNVIEFQDVALAGAYTVEFNEMWGSNTLTPNSSVSRFGARKLNNTPHKFIIGGVDVENYFSPSDRAEAQMQKMLSKAQTSINVAMLTFTRQGYADTIIMKKNAGKKGRVVMDNNTDTGNQFSYLLTNGVDVLLKGGSGLLHHKYAIVDAEPLGGTAYVSTGSHNWSAAAETRNDENTVIVKDDRVANLYLQEFAARYYEAGGTNPIVLGVKEVNNTIPSDYSLSQNYPNPFNPSTTFRFSIVHSQMVTVRVFDVLGREVTTLVNDMKQPGTYEVNWDATGLSSGVYYYQMVAGSFSTVKKMLLMK